jgi:hypothetical protein
VEVQLHEFLTSGLDGDEWLASCPGRFTLEETTPVPNGYEDVSGRTDLEEKNHALLGIEPRSPASSLVTALTELP